MQQTDYYNIMVSVGIQKYNRIFNDFNKAQTCVKVVITPHIRILDFGWLIAGVF